MHDVVLVIAAIMDSMYPTIIESFRRTKEEFDNKNKLLYAIVFYICVIVSAMISILAEPIVRILYGAAYFPSVALPCIVT